MIQQDYHKRNISSTNYSAILSCEMVAERISRKIVILRRTDNLMDGMKG